MAHDIDGFAVLHSISAERRAFAGVAVEAAKAARALVVKQITAKNTDLKSLRDVREALGKEAFSLILDGMKDSQVKSLVTKLDKHHPDLKDSNPEWRRNQVRDLAKGSVEPTPKPEPAPRKIKSKKEGSPAPKSTGKKAGKKQRSDLPGADNLISFSSAGATRKR
jgi:hypothetical protein